MAVTLLLEWFPSVQALVSLQQHPVGWMFPRITGMSNNFCLVEKMLAGISSLPTGYAIKKHRKPILDSAK